MPPDAGNGIVELMPHQGDGESAVAWGNGNEPRAGGEADDLIVEGRSGRLVDCWGSGDGGEAVEEEEKEEG